jgi:hypothetical protein
VIKGDVVKPWSTSRDGFRRARAVPWWTFIPSVPLFNILAHVISETNRHVGHADILREQLDGAAKIATDNPNLPKHDAAWWERYRARVEQAARAAEADKP